MAIESYTDAQGNVHWPEARLGELKDYAWNFADRIVDEGDTTQTLEWTLPTGLTSPEDNLTDDIGVIWISADATGDYEIEGKITTKDLAHDQTYIRIFHLSVV